MAKVYFIATLMILQGFFFLYGETTTTLTVAATPTVTATANGGAVTTTVGGGGISPSTTTTTTNVSSVGPDNKKLGPTVRLGLVVTTNCSGDRLNALNARLQIDILIICTNAGFPIRSVTILSTTCNSPLNVTLEMSFYTGLPSGKTIKKVFQDALRDGNFTFLTESNTNYTMTFIGVTLKYNPKAGQCQAICCDGAGGELTVQRECTPDNKCEGIESDEKEEDGHCPGDSKATCSATCDDDGGSGGVQNSPSYALVTLLAIAKFTKTIFF